MRKAVILVTVLLAACGAPDEPPAFATYEISMTCATGDCAPFEPGARRLTISEWVHGIPDDYSGPGLTLCDEYGQVGYAGAAAEADGAYVSLYGEAITIRSDGDGVEGTIEGDGYAWSISGSVTSAPCVPLW